MDITIIERSNIVIPCSNIGCINPVTPNTARILNILEPITLPIAIPLSPLRAATTLVASSGNDVPPATIVKPIIASDTPNDEATLTAPLTKRLLPKIRHDKPTTVSYTHLTLPTNREV